MALLKSVDCGNDHDVTFPHVEASRAAMDGRSVAAIAPDLSSHPKRPHMHEKHNAGACPCSCGVASQIGGGCALTPQSLDRCLGSY